MLATGLIVPKNNFSLENEEANDVSRHRPLAHSHSAGKHFATTPDAQVQDTYQLASNSSVNPALRLFGLDRQTRQEKTGFYKTARGWLAARLQTRRSELDAAAAVIPSLPRAGAEAVRTFGRYGLVELASSGEPMLVHAAVQRALRGAAEVAAAQPWADLVEVAAGYQPALTKSWQSISGDHLNRNIFSFLYLLHATAGFQAREAGLLTDRFFQTRHHFADRTAVVMAMTLSPHLGSEDDLVPLAERLCSPLSVAQQIAVMQRLAVTCRKGKYVNDPQVRKKATRLAGWLKNHFDQLPSQKISTEAKRELSQTFDKLVG